MSVVAINSAYTNVGASIDSLFGSDVRSESQIQSLISGAIASGQSTVAISSTEVAKIPPIWLAAWQQAQGDKYDPTSFGYCRSSDAQLMSFLAAYIKANNLSLYVPKLALVKTTGSKPTYVLSGYTEYHFLNNGKFDYSSAVHTFLQLLISGAHFVCVSEMLDIGNQGSMQNLYAQLQSSALNSQTVQDPGNSHYAGGGPVTNTTGLYYPSSGHQKTATPLDPNCPFNLALLFGRTVNNSGSPANTFMQLEGWQALSTSQEILSWVKTKTFGTPTRHMADYQVYNDTLWNISTFGASAFSEKRGTAVFLAPRYWNPVPSQNTFMPPYVGAETLQHWLDTSLVQLPSNYGTIVVRSAGTNNINNSGTKVSSPSFSIAVPAGAKQLVWSILYNNAAANITFDVIQWTDVSTDSTPTIVPNPILQKVRNGTTTSSSLGSTAGYGNVPLSFCIANPQGCASSDAFTVQIQAVS